MYKKHKCNKRSKIELNVYIFLATLSAFLKKHRLMPCYSHVINVTSGSHLAAGRKHPPGQPRKTWLQEVIVDQATPSHHASGLWHWRDLVASPWSFYVEIATTLAGQTQQWVCEWDDISTTGHHILILHELSCFICFVTWPTTKIFFLKFKKNQIFIFFSNLKNSFKILFHNCKITAYT